MICYGQVHIFITRRVEVGVHDMGKASTDSQSSAQVLKLGTPC